MENILRQNKDKLYAYTKQEEERTVETVTVTVTVDAATGKETTTVTLTIWTERYAAVTFSKTVLLTTRIFII